MHLGRLILREVLFRKLTFSASVLAVAAAVACLAATVELLRDHDLATEELVAATEAATRARLEEKHEETRSILEEHEKELVRLTKEHEDFTRRTMKDLGFNILILPKDQNLSDLYAEDFASKYMPESYAEKLARSSIVTVNHLLPSLTQKLVWPETKRTIILIGVRGEVPILHRDPKKPLLDPVPEGGAVLGHELHASLGLRAGDTMRLLGREFQVTKCYPARGSKDDITVWIDLATAQELLDKKGKINAILALECNCTADRLPIIRSEIAGILPDTQVIERGTQATVRAEARTQARQLAEETYATAKREAERALEAERRHAQATIAAERAHRTRLRDEREAFAGTLIPLVLAGCAALVGVLAFLNVRERRAEVGILRALGLRAANIIAVVIGRAMLVGLFGALLGLPAGHLIAVLAAESAQARGAGGALIDPLAAGAVLFASPLVAMVASWIPALLAAQEDPAIALRDA